MTARLVIVMHTRFFLPLSCFFLSACTVNTTVRGGHAPGGEIGVAPACDSVSFRGGPRYICPDERVSADWNAPPLAATCSRLSFGTGCIEPPGGLGEICTDLWTDPEDFTSELRLGDCSIARRAAGECIYCRYPASGSESIGPTRDVALRYVAARTYDEGHVSRCFAERQIRLVDPSVTRPHAESFPWICDDGGVGRWQGVEWDAAEFASTSVRLGEVINGSSVPVDVLLRRVNAAGVEVVHTAVNVAPGATLPTEFAGAAHGQWFVTPNPPDRFEPASCPAPPRPGFTSTTPVPFEPFGVPPPLSLEFRFACLPGG